MLWIFGLVAVLGCGAYILLIPLYSYWAAAWTTVAVELLVTLGAAWVTRRKILWRPQWRTCSLAFLASLLMALIIKVSGVHNALVATILGIVVYTSLLLGLKIVPVSLIRQLMKPS